MFKLDFVTLAAIAVLVATVLVGSALFKSIFDNPRVVYTEAPLEKTREFQLRPGETYAYSYLINGTAANMTYAIFEGGNCTRIKVLELRNNSEVCVDRWGVDAGGSNVTYDNPNIILFKPWMLALQEGWAWNSTMYLTFGGAAEHITDTYYRVIRTENYSGRQCYVVEIKTASGAAEYDWVDDEKRVLLRVLGEGYEVVLSNESAAALPD